MKNMSFLTPYEEGPMGENKREERNVQGVSGFKPKVYQLYENHSALRVAIVRCSFARCRLVLLLCALRYVRCSFELQFCALQVLAAALRAAVLRAAICALQFCAINLFQQQQLPACRHVLSPPCTSCR
ncbi:hypothetical protein ACFE04_024590 [Oxalis oulophora]